MKDHCLQFCSLTNLVLLEPTNDYRLTVDLIWAEVVAGFERFGYSAMLWITMHLAISFLVLSREWSRTKLQATVSGNATIDIGRFWEILLIGYCFIATNINFWVGFCYHPSSSHVNIWAFSEARLHILNLSDKHASYLGSKGGKTKECVAKNEYKEVSVWFPATYSSTQPHSLAASRVWKAITTLAGCFNEIANLMHSREGV